jgi:hypothetical protein
MTRYLLLFDSYGLVFVGRPLWGEDGSFVYAAGLRQRSLSWVWVPWNLWPSFTLSDLRFSFSSPPTTRRVAVELFDPASTRMINSSQSQSYFASGGLPQISPSWRRAPWDSRPGFFPQLNTCDHSPYITSSLTRGWVCHLQLLLALSGCVKSSLYSLGADPQKTLLPLFLHVDSLLQVCIYITIA